MKQNKRFVSKKDNDGYWKVYDKQKQTFSKDGFLSRQLAINLAKVYEDHALSLTNK